MDILIVVVLVFGICFGADKLFQKCFRDRKQHISGTAIRLNKRYATIGLLLLIVGISALFVGKLILIIGGSVLILTGIVLIVYYLSFGIYYDKDSFLHSRFGHKSTTYSYKDIQSQSLYTSAGGIIVELHMENGKSVLLQTSLSGAYRFLDTAFAGWLEQTGRKQEDCDFYDPDNSCWFPPVEV
jgi:hypothetical protein